MTIVPEISMFHTVRNTRKTGTTIQRLAVDTLEGRLPPSWRIDVRSDSIPILRVRPPKGSAATFSLVAKKNLSPKGVATLLVETEVLRFPVLLVAPFLSPRTRDLLREADVSYLDGTGNLRVACDSPALFIEGEGAVRNPARKPRPLHSLKGPAAARVVRALCDFRPPYGVRELAESSRSALGSTSRVVSFLEDEALLTRDDKKQIVAVDWSALIERWTRDYEVGQSNRRLTCLEPRGLDALVSKLGGLKRYAVTGSLAGTGISPARLAMIYVDDAEAAASKLDLVTAAQGSNVWLLEPYDEVVFERMESRKLKSATRNVVAPSQLAVDLLTSPGRGPQEGEALLEKLKADEGWRHEL